MDVTEFLHARIAEDEAALEGVDDGDPAARSDVVAPPFAARARAECRAKRAILALHRGAADVWGFHGCLTCGNVADTTAGYPCPTVRALAAVYADHPGYRAEWR